MNLIAQLELKLAYYNAAVQHISHYAIGTHPFWYQDMAIKLDVNNNVECFFSSLSDMHILLCSYVVALLSRMTDEY